MNQKYLLAGACISALLPNIHEARADNSAWQYCYNSAWTSGLNTWLPCSLNTPLPVGPPTSAMVSGTGAANSTVAATIIAAPSANKIYVTGVQCGRTDSGTTAVRVTLNDSQSTVIVLPGSVGGGINDAVFSTPIQVAATTALTFTPSSSVSTIYCSGQGYNAP